MLSPLDLRLQAAGGGEEAEIRIYSPQDYSPKVDYQPQDPAKHTVHGIYEKTPQDGPVARYQAKFMFPCREPIEDILSDRTRLYIDGHEYSAKNVRARHYMGMLDGYSMDLEL